MLTAIFAFLSLACQCQERKQSYTDFNRGYYLWYYNKWDSAYDAFSKYVNKADDSLNKASAYKFMGEIQWYFGDLYGAQENLLNAIKILDTSKLEYHQELSYVYNILGNVSLDLASYKKAVQFYDRGIRFSHTLDFTYELLNGKALALRRSGNYNAAIGIYDSVLAMKPADQSLVARIIDNRANTLWLQNSNYPVLPEFRTALKIRLDSQNIAGLVKSYEHLTNYYAKPESDSALWYANKMFSKAKELGNIDDMIRAADMLVGYNNDPSKKNNWHKTYKVLNDSLQLSRDTARNRYALVKFDFQTIEAKNMLLQKYLTTQRILTYIVVILATGIIIGLVLSYKNRRKAIKAEAEKSIQQSKLKTSQKVHDVVANGLYIIMNELEHGKTMEKEELINKIEDLYEQSRNISYEGDASDEHTDYDSQVHSLLDDFSTGQTEVYAQGNQPAFWNNVTTAQKDELFLVLKELLVNMKKHSSAKNVSLVFRQENNRGVVIYKDDGTGFPDNVEYGNGLKNTVNRILSLNGEVNFGKSEKGGASVSISFPLQPEKL